MFLRSEFEQARFDRAFAFASWHHLGHVRKYTGEPYVNHVHNVAESVSHAPLRTMEMIEAALLHDVLEDTAASEADVEANFGRTVLDYVLALSDERFNMPKVGNRKQRKAATLMRYANEAFDYAIHTVKLADLIDNSASITQHDPDFARVYMREKQDLLKVLVVGDSGLQKFAQAIVNNYYTVRQ